MRFSSCSGYEKGFHDGNVWGPFSFAVCLRFSLLFRPPESLVEAVQLASDEIREAWAVCRLNSNQRLLRCLLHRHANRSVVRGPDIGRGGRLGFLWCLRRLQDSEEGAKAFIVGLSSCEILRGDERDGLARIGGCQHDLLEFFPAISPDAFRPPPLPQGLPLE